MTVWEALFEKAIVPLGGFVALMLGAAGKWPVPVPLYPFLGGMIGYPGIRTLDRIRRTGNGKT